MAHDALVASSVCGARGAASIENSAVRSKSKRAAARLSFRGDWLLWDPASGKRRSHL